MTTRSDSAARIHPLYPLALIAILAALVYGLTRPDGSALVIAAPSGQVVLVVTVITTPTRTPSPVATQTPWVKIATPTPNASASATIPPCWEARGGDVCVRYGIAANTATAVPWCSDTPDHGIAVLCRKDTDGTEREQETG